jgi:large subunit ribosomal protein L7/L12
MTNVEQFADQLVTLDVKQLIELKKVLKDKYGLEETVAVTTTIIEEKPIVEEKTHFNVRIIKVSEITAEKLNSVKVINKILECGLKTANDMIKVLPVILKENVPKMEAESIKSELGVLNAIVELY